MKSTLAAIITFDFSSHGFKKFRKRALRVMIMRKMARPIAHRLVRIVIRRF